MTAPNEEWDAPHAAVEEAPETAHADDLDTLLRPRLTRRARLLRAGALLALVAVISAGLFLHVESVGTASIVPVPSPSPAVTPAPPILILSNVNYGTLTVNGYTLAGPPAIFRPRAGQNTLTLLAEPFEPTICIFSWPKFLPVSGNCSYASGAPKTEVLDHHSFSIEREVIIVVRGNQLSSSACARVQRTVSAGLAAARAETQVPVGQYIATGTDSNGIPNTMRATTPLVARLVAALPLPAQAYGAPCITLNEGNPWEPNAMPTKQEHHWIAQFYAALSMVFATPSGREVARTHDYHASLTVDLIASAGGDWTLADPAPFDIQLAQSLCDAGGQDIVSAVKGLNPGAELGWSSTSAEGMQGIQGCRLEVNTNDTDGQPGTPAVFVWRFGALLAANDAARKLLPAAPTAPKDEIAAVPRQ